MSGPLLSGHAPFFSRRSMSMVPCGNTLICFGGVGAAGTESILDVTDECWLFELEQLQWRQVRSRGPWPSPRRCPGFAPTRSGAYLWGGSGIDDAAAKARYTFLNDCWRFDLESETWQKLQSSDDHRLTPTLDDGLSHPLPRYTPVFQPLGDRSYLLYSGYTEDRLGKRNLDDAWIWNEAEWTPMPPAGAAGYGGTASWPAVRYGASSSAAAGMVYVFGGYSAAGDHNDMWQFDGARRSWTLLSAHDARGGPPPRYCAATAAHHHSIFLFGGRSRRNPKENFNDLWVFDVPSRSWRCVIANHGSHVYDATATSPGYHAKSAHAVAGDNWYLWGGEGRRGHVSDFWRFSMAERRWQMLQAARPDDPVFW